MLTSAPSRANRTATARPIPELGKISTYETGREVMNGQDEEIDRKAYSPPVIKAVLPFNLFAGMY